MIKNLKGHKTIIVGVMRAIITGIARYILKYAAIITGIARYILKSAAIGGAGAGALCFSVVR